MKARFVFLALTSMSIGWILIFATASWTVASDSLPAYCGDVGASRYSVPATLTPTVVRERGTTITVTNATNVVNGDATSAPALLAQ